MQNNNNINNCCCSCGVKKALCIIKNLKNFIDTSRVYYSCGNSNGEIKDSKYSNFILLEEETNESFLSEKKLYINLCIEDISFIEIIPKDLNYQSIINELNKEYASPLTLNTNFDENCCCKFSTISYLVDKYLECNPLKRQFYLNVNGLTNTVPPFLDSCSSICTVTVLHLDYDVVWLLDSVNKIIYLVSLCSICALID